MKTLITTIAILITNLIFAQTQFEQGMGQALGLWKEGKNSEAVSLFERIAAAEKTSWLPNYYAATVNTFASFATKHKTQMTAMLAKAQETLDIEIAKDPNNAELLVMQAMIHTAWISSDPMVYGMTLSAKVAELYEKAEAIAPTNPRVVFSKADFAIGGAAWTGADVKVLCKDVQRSLELFATFKPESQFHPNWGLQRAEQAAKRCTK